MPRPEDESRDEVNPDLQPFELPAALAEFLADQEYAMVTESSNQGTVFVVKAPTRDIASISGAVPMEARHELHQHAVAPVIRIVVRIHDQPGRSLALENFINVADEQQRAEYAQLVEQDELLFLFYDETLSHRLTKRMRNGVRSHMESILKGADRKKAALPEQEYDFDRAKAAVMKTTDL